jgi:hypothetical protein
MIQPPLNDFSISLEHNFNDFSMKIEGCFDDFSIENSGGFNDFSNSSGETVAHSSVKRIHSCGFLGKRAK